MVPAVASHTTPSMASGTRCALGWLLYLLAMAALAMALPSGAFESRSGKLILFLGLIGSWRYSWQALHLLRGVWYRRVVFPRWRRQVNELGADGRLCSVFFLVTSYRMQSDANLTTFRALFSEAVSYGSPVTIVASITDPGDEELIETLFASYQPGRHIELVLMQQAGLGKREAMAAGLRAISRRNPPPGSAVVLMDGDTVLPEGTLSRSLSFFALMPDLGALTVDNRATVTGGKWAEEWYELRLAQRHIYMSSIALSRRLLVLTGRFSVFRSEIATESSFIKRVEHDFIDHWRLGRIRFLTGDDKSTWFWLLERRWAMLYLPDVSVVCQEELPGKWLVPCSIRLMQRWFGNMLRNNVRAIRLGPRHVGFFTWWCLVDQRLSIWTTISGPIFAMLFFLAGTPEAVGIYVLWVMITRFGQTFVVFLNRKRLSPYVPPLLYFTQVVGSLVKLYMLFRLDRQSWTRQGVRTVTAQGPAVIFKNAFTIYLNVLALAVFLYFAALLVGLVPPPSLLV